MYKCDKCCKTSQKGEAQNKITTERRRKEYKNVEGEVKGTGWEIAKELRLCSNCFSETQQEIASAGL